EGEKITTLDNQKFDLTPQILIIADTQKPLAIAGIKGGKGPEIDSGTKIVVLEAANFNPAIIRKGSRGLGLRTDASLRFEHGVDPNLTESAINRAAYLIQKLALGKTANDSVDLYPQKVYPQKIKLDLNYAKNLLGIEIPEREIKNILTRLNFKVIGVRNPLSVEIPTSRLDILIPEDLIEEIGRIYGYDKVIPVFPTASLVPPKRNDDILWENTIKNIMKEAGFTESYNYSFQKDPSASSSQGPAEVENPTSQEYRYLRPSLMPNLLKNIEKNIKTFGQIKIFEIGKIFTDKTEKRMFTGVAAGHDFYQVKGVIDLLFDKLGVAKVWYDDYQATPEDSSKSLWKEKKSAEIKVGDVEVGFLGELKNEQKLVAFDLDFEKLKTLALEDQEYKSISKYPATIRDLAVLVPPTTKVEEVLNVMDIAGGSLVVDIDLFDIYEGEGIPDGQKNLAFHIIYQAQDRTLTSIEVYKIHQNIIKALEENPTWQVRK
ncbi:MAG: phenylalanine--tRNA ligase subunit beta, partial [Candidatus Nealsonbacteria bacterium]|nr:phenylalanine--tRNA ligase subunit beta [Candidatus Nealsonbacteria bacterium]